MHKLTNFGVLFLVCGALAWTTATVMADDETGDTSISVRAAIDAVSCTTSPQTVTLLGVTIDITSATFNSSGDGSGDGGGMTGGGTGGTTAGGDDGVSGATSGGDGSGDDGGGSAASADCAGLTIGQLVEVGLASDAAPLTGTTVDSSGEGDVKIQGPIQAIDTVGQTVTVLGLTINMASAQVDGADDNSGDGTSQAIDLTTLMVGQIVETRLDSSQLPSLVATEAVVKNFANQVEVEVDDASGTPIADSTDDVSTDAADIVTVQAPGGTSMMRKVVHVRASSNGGVTLTGLPTGHARITVKRTVNGKARKRSVRVSIQPNMSQHVRIKLK